MTKHKVKAEHDDLTLPTEEEWAELLEGLPTERVELDKDGNYDPEQSPEWHEWIKNG